MSTSDDQYDDWFSTERGTELEDDDDRPDYDVMDDSDE